MPLRLHTTKVKVEIHQCYFHRCVNVPLKSIAICHLSTRCCWSFPIDYGHLILASTCSAVSHSPAPHPPPSIHHLLFPSQLSDCQCCLMPLLSRLLNLNLNPAPRLAAFACRQSLFHLSLIWPCLTFFVWLLSLPDNSAAKAANGTVLKSYSAAP